MNIQLNIERLVLDGINLTNRERQRLGAGLTAELERRLAADGLAAAMLAGGALPSLPGGAFEWKPGQEPEALGAQIAGAIYEGIGR